MSADLAADGTDPIELAAVPFDMAARFAELFATTETDRWGGWLLASGVVDAAAIEGGGLGALDAILAGVLAAVDQGWFGSSSWAQLVAAGPIPLWCRLRPGYEAYLGVTGCWVVAGVIALTARWIEREWGGRWMLPPDTPGVGRSAPTLEIPGGIGLVPQVQLVSAVGAAAGLRGDPARDPHRLRDLVQLHAPADGTRSSPFGGDELTGPVVDAADRPGRWLVSFSDTQGVDEDGRIDRLVAGLATMPEIRQVHREDRELLLVESGLDQTQLQDAVEASWISAEG